MTNLSNTQSQVLPHEHEISEINGLGTSLSGKQDKLVAGSNISIAADGKTISATDTKYTAGTNVQIDANNKISATDTKYDPATQSAAGLMSAADKTKLDGIAEGAGVQLLTGVKGDAESSYRTGNVNITKSNIGLGNVDNTSDANKPVSTATQSALNLKQNIADMPTDLGDFTNNAGFIKNTVNNLTNYYKKTETYTKTEIDTLISNFGGFEVVATLPTSNIKTNVIYLLGPIGTGADKYEEWIYYSSTWTKIGETSVDLTNYAQKSEVLTKTNTTSFTPTADYHPATKKYVDDTASGKVSDTAYASSWNGVTNVAPSKNAVYDKINGMISDTAYGSSWNGVTTVAPSKNAVYDKIETLPSTAGKGIDITSKVVSAKVGKGLEIGDDYSAMRGPCPAGFHAPLTTEWQAVYNIWTALGGGSSDGTNFGIALKLPFAGYRTYVDTNVNGVGSLGRYWSSSPFNANNAYRLYFNSSSIYPQFDDRRSYGFSVRCFKNSPTIPTSSWTKLYGTSIEAGGIFWSSTDGLISLSSNGSTWITIADKNLGATTVWNSGDTLSEANCGKYYQRGNNYGFPRTGTIANQSTTQVDASSYGPGNYYSSDTFIKYSGRWDTTDNGNLRGGETGVISNAIINAGVTSVNGETGDVTVPKISSLPNNILTSCELWAGKHSDYLAMGSGRPSTTLFFCIKDILTYDFTISNQGWTAQSLYGTPSYVSGEGWTLGSASSDSQSYISMPSGAYNGKALKKINLYFYKGAATTHSNPNSYGVGSGLCIPGTNNEIIWSCAGINVNNDQIRKVVSGSSAYIQTANITGEVKMVFDFTDTSSVSLSINNNSYNLGNIGATYLSAWSNETLGINIANWRCDNTNIYVRKIEIETE